MSFTDTELEYMSTQRLGRIATAQADGTLQVSPVSFRYNDGTGTIDVAGRAMATSRKFRNVAANGQVAFVIDDFVSLQPWRPRCVEIRGTGEAIAEPADSAWATDLAQTGVDGAIIRIRPQRIISFGVDDANRDVPVYRIDARTVS